MRFQLQLIDPGFKRHVRSYVFQCLFATLVLFAVLSMKDVLAQGAIIAAIGSTTFVLFIMPHSLTARPRHVLGGHFLGLAIGGVVGAFDTTGLGQHILANIPLAFEIAAAAAVGVAIFGMAATNTEHAPAAGTALGMAVQPFSWGLVAFVVSSVVALSLAHRILRPWLRDLL